MKIGFFTDTYYPQVSGVATSILTLKEELENNGHKVYIFTTTDPNAHNFEEDIIRMPSVPFVSFKERRIVVRGMLYAYMVAKELELDIIHTHTEFGAGFLGKMVAKKLRIPVLHTYHTMYEEYLHYIAKGKVLRPSHVKAFSRLFANHSTGVICPSERVLYKLKDYGVTTPMRVIPTGIRLENFKASAVTEEKIAQLRTELGYTKDNIVLLSLSRISYEKNIQTILAGFPQVLAQLPNVRLLVVGDGPYLAKLKKQAQALKIAPYVQFIGEVPNEEVSLYYKSADYFVSASTSETQGLTYTEAMVAGLPCVVGGNVYLDQLFDHPSLGVTFQKDEEFAPLLIQYILSDRPNHAEVLQQKLETISSVYFGKRMLAFYEDMLRFHQRQQKRQKRLAKTSIKRIKVKISSLIK